MNLDTYVMIARAEQERRIAEAAKYHLLFEAERARRANRAGIFSRRNRNTK